jgi:antitoxin MazE
MVTKIQKWGNSLAIRIPKAFAHEMRLKENSSIEIVMKEETLIITPYDEKERSLEMLLSQVTEDNLHHGWETGEPQGDEML